MPFDVVGGASHFEIVHVHTEHALQVPMDKQALPTWHGHESSFFEFGLAVAFPEDAGHGVSVEGQTQRADGVKFWI